MQIGLLWYYVCVCVRESVGKTTEMFTTDQKVYLFKSFVDVCVCLGQVLSILWAPNVPSIVKSESTYIVASKQLNIHTKYHIKKI